MATKDKRYLGLENDPTGAMNATGNIIRDAWVFGLIPEEETCNGWTGTMVDALYDKVHLQWQKYGHRVSALPPELMEKHKRIYSEAMVMARAKGWDPELADDD